MMISFAVNVVVVLLLLLAVSFALESRVVGGNFVSIKKFPHSVFLDCLCDDGESICGASVLNQMIILTAAHCMHDCTGRWTVKAFVGNEHLQKVGYDLFQSIDAVGNKYLECINGTSVMIDYGEE